MGLVWLALGILKTVHAINGEIEDTFEYVILGVAYFLFFLCAGSFLFDFIRKKRNGEQEEDEVTSDERSIAISNKASSITLFILFFACLIAVIVLKILKIMPAVYAIGGVALLGCLVYIVVRIILSRKM